MNCFILTTIMLCSFLHIDSVLAGAVGPDCPSGCTCYKRKVDCSNAKLLSIPSNLAPTIRNLNLGENQLQFFSGKEIDNLTLLRKLFLNRNQIETVDENAFTLFKYLRLLDLSSNQIQELFRGMFSQLGKLQELNLANNHIQIVDGVFSNLKSLAHLDLSKNRIQHLSDTVFEDNVRLNTLLLPENDITYSKIAQTTFKNLKNLQYVSFADNPSLFRVDNLFLTNEKLESIDLTGCQIISFPKVLPFSLRNLEMSQNNITMISKLQLDPLINLRTLNLVQNQITNIENDSFINMVSLQELWLSSNFISNLPTGLPENMLKLYADMNELEIINGYTTFHALSKLVIMSLRSNKIAQLKTNDFQNLKLLEELDLADNRFVEIPSGVFEGLPNLSILSLQRLDLTHINTSAFTGLEHLTQLDLSFILLQGTPNEVIETGDIFRPLTSLKTLSLQESSKLTEIFLKSDILKVTPNPLRMINLMDCSITTISNSTFSSLNRMATISLAGNKFHCDRDLIWLKYSILTRRHAYAQPEEYTCFTPPSLQGYVIQNIVDTQFVPVTQEMYTTSQVMTSAVTKVSQYPTTPMERSTRSNPDSSSMAYSDMTPSVAMETNTSVTKAPASHGNQHEADITTVLLSVMAASVIIGIIAVLAIIYYKKRNRFLQAFQYHQEDSAFYGEDEDSMPQHLEVVDVVTAQMTREDRGSTTSWTAQMTREDRGSTTSWTSEDITNQCDGNTKIYIWDAK